MHEVPLFCVVKYSVVLNDNIKLLLHWDILPSIWVFIYFLLQTFSESFWGSLCADLYCSNPLKAQLGDCGFSYHSSRINVLIILCGHTGGVITIHSSWAEGRQWGADLGLGGWTLRFCSALALKWVVAEHTGYFWTSNWLNPSLEMELLPHVAGWTSVSCQHVFTLQKHHLFFSDKQKISLPTPWLFSWNPIKECTFSLLLQPSVCVIAQQLLLVGLKGFVDLF